MSQMILVGVFMLLLTCSTVSIGEPEKALYRYASLSLELGTKAAQGAITECRKKGYSITVAIVDRGGNLQVFMRDRFAGPHTIETAIRKAWTANSFRQSTGQLAELLKRQVIPDQVQHNPGALLVGGGLLIQAQGTVIGGIGVSGAPPGKSEQESIDGVCAKAGLVVIEEQLEFAEM